MRRTQHHHDSTVRRCRRVLAALGAGLTPRHQLSLHPAAVTLWLLAVASAALAIGRWIAHAAHWTTFMGIACLLWLNVAAGVVCELVGSRWESRVLPSFDRRQLVHVGRRPRLERNPLRRVLNTSPSLICRGANLGQPGIARNSFPHHSREKNP